MRLWLLTHASGEMSRRQAGELSEARRLLEGWYLEKVRRELSGLPVIELALMSGEVVRADGLGRLTRHLVKR